MNTTVMKRNVALKSRLFADGLTQRLLSVRAGIPETRLSSIINGRIEPSAAERTAIAEVLMAAEDALFLGVDQP